MSFPRYPAYKDSGVEWLGHIPEHWATYRYRRLFTEVADLAETDDEELLTVSHITGVTPRSEKNVNMFLAESLEGYKRCQQGDTVINTMWAWMGALGVAFQQGVVSPSYNVYRPRPEITHQLEPRFFDRLYRTEAHIAEINRFSKGVWASRLRLYPQSFFEMTTVCPPIDEQRAIAAFLDAETARIDALVAKQEALIATLQEKRRALISHAVTKGIDPAAPMRDSGVPWLGEVPAHWEVKHLKHCIRAGTSISYGIVQPGENVEDGVPFVQTTNISSGNFGIENLQRTAPEIAEQYPRSRLKAGDVMLGIRASIGAAHVVPLELNGANLSRGVARIAVNDLITAEFLVNYLDSAQAASYWDRENQGSTFREVSIATVRELSVPIPSWKEQLVISIWIRGNVEQIDNLIAKANALIELLREHRTALIAAAVTGQIDVRGIQQLSNGPVE